MRTTIIFLFFVAFVSTGNAQEPIFQWQKTGPFGGDITSIAGNDSFLLIGTGTARMLRSTNQGATWNPSSDGVGLKYLENSARQIVQTSQSQIAALNKAATFKAVRCNKGSSTRVGAREDDVEQRVHSSSDQRENQSILRV